MSVSTSHQSSTKCSSQSADTIFCLTKDHKYKIVLVGDSGVGKTSLFWQYIEEVFPEDVSELKVTMVDFKIKNIVLDNELVKLYIWDTAGQERYRSLVSNYFKGAHGIMMVFDLGCTSSFQSVQSSWLSLCRDKSPDARLVLVGNKSDQETRAVNSQQIEAFIAASSMKYFEVSAFSGDNVSEAFDHLAYSIQERFFPKKELAFLEDSKQTIEEKNSQQDLAAETDKSLPPRINYSHRESFALKTMLVKSKKNSHKIASDCKC